MNFKQYRIFSEFDENEVSQARRFISVNDYQKDEKLFKCYAESASFFIIVSGMVGISRNGAVIAHRNEGEVIGEQGIIDGTPRSADAVAQGEVKAIEVSNRILDNVNLTQKIYKQLLQILSEKLRQASVARNVSIKREKALRMQLNEMLPVENFDQILKKLDRELPT